MLEILKQCQRELSAWPEELKGDLADALAKLERGVILSMPLSRPMQSIGKGVSELRFRDRSGVYRVIYWVSTSRRIWLIHAFKKKSQATPLISIRTSRERLKRIIK